MDLRDLAKEFPPASVHWRVQGQPYERNGRFSAMALAYLDARDVMDRLDEVCGPDGWQSEFHETSSGRVLCRLGIRTESGWVWKTDGAGGTQVEAEKGGISDALKRAAVSWGVGRYLYRLDSPWVQCEVKQAKGKTYWKRWTEDPWSKVRKVGYQPTLPPDVEPDYSEYIPAAARDRIKTRIEKARTLPDLAAIWKAEAETIARIKADMPPMFGELNKAKEDRKVQLGANGPQAPLDSGDHIPGAMQ